MINRGLPKLIILLAWILAACNTGPKVIPVEEDSNEAARSTGVFSEENSGHEAHDHPIPGVPSNKELHTVRVKEVLPTDKYVYLFVEEEGQEFWIATTKVEVEVGKVYFYRNGLLKTDFHSKEYNRTFDQMYLVSQIVPADHGTGEVMNANSSTSKIESIQSELQSKDIVVEGSVRIAELVGDPKKYEGKEIQLSGIISKVNPNIMNRNWLHLKDGSKDDYDLVITSEHAIPEGHTVTLKGVVALNKDFGAGYKYAIIVEDAHLMR